LNLDAKATSTYQAFPQRVDSVSCKPSNYIVVVVVAIIVNMLDDSQSDLGEVKLADHGVADYTMLAVYSNRKGIALYRR
jgi:hypothetical protein